MIASWAVLPPAGLLEATRAITKEEVTRATRETSTTKDKGITIRWEEETSEEPERGVKDHHKATWDQDPRVEPGVRALPTTTWGDSTTWGDLDLTTWEDLRAITWDKHLRTWAVLDPTWAETWEVVTSTTTTKVLQFSNTATISPSSSDNPDNSRETSSSTQITITVATATSQSSSTPVTTVIRIRAVFTETTPAVDTTTLATKEEDTTKVDKVATTREVKEGTINHQVATKVDITRAVTTKAAVVVATRVATKAVSKVTKVDTKVEIREVVTKTTRVVTKVEGVDIKVDEVETEAGTTTEEDPAEEAAAGEVAAEGAVDREISVVVRH